jgi:hypothetical protein
MARGSRERVWNPQSRTPSSAALYRLTHRAFATAMLSLLPELSKKKNQILGKPPMNRVTIVIPAFASRSRTIDQRGN